MGNDIWITTFSFLFTKLMKLFNEKRMNYSFHHDGSCSNWNKKREGKNKYNII